MKKPWLKRSTKLDHHHLGDFFFLDTYFKKHPRSKSKRNDITQKSSFLPRNLRHVNLEGPGPNFPMPPTFVRNRNRPQKTPFLIPNSNPIKRPIVPWPQGWPWGLGPSKFPWAPKTGRRRGTGSVVAVAVLLAVDRHARKHPVVGGWGLWFCNKVFWDDFFKHVSMVGFLLSYGCSYDIYSLHISFFCRGNSILQVEHITTTFMQWKWGVFLTSWLVILRESNIAKGFLHNRGISRWMAKHHQLDVLSGANARATKTRWWFETFFIFIPMWGNDPFGLIFFRWVETTNQKNLLCFPQVPEKSF